MYSDKILDEINNMIEKAIVGNNMELELYQSLPKNPLIIAFIQGAQWWEYHKTKFTMWQSDQCIAEKEAMSRLLNDTLGKTIEEIVNENAKNKTIGNSK